MAPEGVRRAYVASTFLFSAVLAVTDDVLIAASLDGEVNAFATADGRETWSYSVNKDLEDVNGNMGEGGTIDAADLVIAGDGIVVNSGYNGPFGGVGRYPTQPGKASTLFLTG